MPSLDRLQDLTERLAPTLCDYVGMDNPARVYLTPSGRIVGICAYADHEVAFMRMMAAPGTVLPDHMHADEGETVGIISGSAVLTMHAGDGTITTLTMPQGSSAHVPKGVVHSMQFPETTLLWCVSAPPAPGYPLPVDKC